MQVTIHYQIKVNNYAILPPDGWSGYTKRYELYFAGHITHDQIYGLEQAKEHAKEYFNVKNEYSDRRSKEILTIEKVVTVSAAVEEVRHP